MTGATDEPAGTRSATAPGAAQHALRPTSPRWTHVALPCHDIDESIAWYQRYTPLELLDRREDADGYTAWLAHHDQGAPPFVLVLVSLFDDQPKGPQPMLAPFAHLGIELPTKAAVDEVAARAEAEGCLHWPPAQLPPPVGYVCAGTDPDGNVVEFSFDQGVYAKAREVWG